MLGHMDGYGWGGMGIGMALWWVLLGVVVVLLVRYVLRPDKEKDKGAPKSAREILDERYARGQIGREEYDQKKHDLGT